MGACHRGRKGSLHVSNLHFECTFVGQIIPVHVHHVTAISLISNMIIILHCLPFRRMFFVQLRSCLQHGCRLTHSLWESATCLCSIVACASGLIPEFSELIKHS